MINLFFLNVELDILLLHILTFKQKTMLHFVKFLVHILLSNISFLYAMIVHKFVLDLIGSLFTKLEFWSCSL
jgi:hypothetical protein